PSLTGSTAPARLNVAPHQQPDNMHISPSPRWLVLLPALLLAGCEKDENPKETVPRQAPLPFPFELPHCWGENGRREERRGGIHVDILAAFGLAGGAADDEMNVTALRSEMNKKLAVTRWREQVGHPPEEKAPESQPLKVGGIKADYYDIPGPK